VTEQTMRIGPKGVIGFDGRPLNIPEGQMIGADGRLAPLPANVTGLPKPGAAAVVEAAAPKSRVETGPGNGATADSEAPLNVVEPLLPSNLPPQATPGSAPTPSPLPPGGAPGTKPVPPAEPSAQTPAPPGAGTIEPAAPTPAPAPTPGGAPGGAAPGSTGGAGTGSSGGSGAR
jgi:hypothetical protein